MISGWSLIVSRGTMVFWRGRRLVWAIGMAIVAIGISGRIRIVSHTYFRFERLLDFGRGISEIILACLRDLGIMKKRASLPFVVCGGDLVMRLYSSAGAKIGFGGRNESALC